MQTPSIPKGTRDFGQQDMAERNYIFDTIKSVFRTFGYAQIETPAMENLSTLLGKYGEEGDKLLFRIQNSGEKAALAPEKGLRYDLTVPFARYVVQHRSEISFPFKRFQIQPVWRADRPQKGRYREFYQCDVDVIGSRSQVNELELVQMVDRVFSLLDVRVLVKINNRKVLTGFAEICGFPDKVVDITVAIDKLDKIGLENVEAEMLEKGLTPAAVEVIRPILQLSGTTEEKLSRMRELMKGGSASGLVSETGLKGLDELEELFGLIGAAGVACPVEIDRLGHRQHLRRWPVRQPDRNLRPARYLGRGHFLRRRPYLRRAQGSGQVPQEPAQHYTVAAGQHGRGGGALPPARGIGPACCRCGRRDLSRGGQTQEAV